MVCCCFKAFHPLEEFSHFLDQFGNLSRGHSFATFAAYVLSRVSEDGHPVWDVLGNGADRRDPDAGAQARVVENDCLAAGDAPISDVYTSGNPSLTR